jgi:hypothetical protein
MGIRVPHRHMGIRVWFCGNLDKIGGGGDHVGSAVHRDWLPHRQMSIGVPHRHMGIRAKADER